MMTFKVYITLGAAVFMLLFFACNKTATDPNNPPPSKTLSYGDSVFYVRNQVGDYIVYPTETRKGTYIGFPDGVQIDDNSGAITVNKSETGLRYKISFIPLGTADTISTIVLISGINFLDKIYNLSTNDTLATPIYNANSNNSMPGTNGTSLFDDGGGCNNLGIAVSTLNGKINLGQTVRNGVFGSTPSNGQNAEVELKYRLDDPSQKASNSLKVKLYYFNTANDLTPDLIQLLQDRQGTILRAAIDIAAPAFDPQSNARLDQVQRAAKPRPPCIFIVGH